MHCVCMAGWTGHKCSEPIGCSEAMICMNGGKCVMPPGLPAKCI